MTTTDDTARLARPTTEIGARTSAASTNGASGGRTWQRELAGMLQHRWPRAVMCGLIVGIMLGLMAGALKKQGATVYTATTTMALDDPLGLALAGDEGELIKLSDLRYKYSSLATTDAVAGPVATDLHVPVGLVLEATSVQVPANLLLMYVSGTWSTPGFAMELSTATAQELVHYVQQENATYAIPKSDQFEAVILSSATSATASSPSTSKAVTEGVLVLFGGGVVGFVVFQLAGGLYRSRRRS